MRINPAKIQKEPTYQVVLDALTLTTCYLAFLITADVPKIYVHQFWFTINKKDSTSYPFKIDKKRYRIDIEVFREILQICPRLSNQEFDALPSNEKIVSFIKELGHKGDIKTVTDVVVDQMHQPWRTFASIINKCLYGKIIDFTFQVENRDTKKQEKMYYPRFTKAIIHHFITKDKSISMRNIMFMHNAQDDSILGPMRFVSKPDNYQVYGALLPEVMTIQKMRASPTYKTYLPLATGAATPKKAMKFKKLTSPLKKKTLVIIEEPEPAKKLYLPRSLQENSLLVYKSETLLETNTHQTSGLGDGAAFQLEVPDEPKGRSVDTHKGTGLNPEINDEDEESKDAFVHTPKDYVPTDDETNDVDEEEYEQLNEEMYGDFHIRLTDAEHNNKEKEDAEMTNATYVQVEHTQEQTTGVQEESDAFVHTPKDYVPTDDETNDVDEEEYEQLNEEMYGDFNIRLTDAEHNNKEKEDAEITNATYVHVEHTQEQTMGVQEESGS
nr:hypothetical protein [Tanacetum cinerariifolium]